MGIHLKKINNSLFPLILLTIIFGVSLTAGPVSAQASPPYKRIISLYSAHTENLVSMGAADQLVGISVSDNFPEHILHKKRYSYREDPERFIAATPDLILIRPMVERSYPQLISKLREVGITVISLQPTSFDDIFDYWRKLGELTGKQENVEEMIRNFTTGLSKMERVVSAIPINERPGVYFESMHRKMKTFAPTSIALFALDRAGGRNIAIDAKQIRNTNIAMYSKERILSHADEIDIFLAQKGRMNPIEIDIIKKESGFKAIKAVRDDRVYTISEYLVSRPTMRLLQGIKKIHLKLYPESSLLTGEKK